MPIAPDPSMVPVLIEILESYYSWSQTIGQAGVDAATDEACARYRSAQIVMGAVVEASKSDLSARALFAQHNLFSRALNYEIAPDNVTPYLQALLSSANAETMCAPGASVNQAIFMQSFLGSLVGTDSSVLVSFMDKSAQNNAPGVFRAGVANNPPRQIMLQGIYDTRLGEFFSSPDLSGFTTWLTEDGQSFPSVIADNVEYNDPAIQLLLLRCLADLAAPASWFRGPQAQGHQTAPQPEILQSVTALQQRLPSSPLDQGVRGALSRGCLDVTARFQREAASVATQAAIAALPTFPTLGDGRETPTVPGSPRPWYRSGWSLIAGGAALVAGARFANRK